jgi:GNAT superfamily N-acetyltransferase
VIHIRPFRTEDVARGLALTRQAGWNQTERDWRRLFDLDPDGCFVAELNSEPVATLTCARYGPVAWLAMMLVDQDRRGQGIGRALMSHALAWLDASAVRTARLDATPLGRPLYERLGFVPEYSIARHTGRPSAGPQAALAPDPANLDDLHRIDREASGIDRRRLIDRLIAEDPAAVRVVVGHDGAIAGYTLARSGFHATHVGPCIATPEAGRALLDDILSRQADRPVLIDVPIDHAEALRVVRDRGLAVQRDLLRMTRGEPVAERTGNIWAIAGPELG